MNSSQGRFGELQLEGLQGPLPLRTRTEELTHRTRSVATSSRRGQDRTLFDRNLSVKRGSWFS